MISIIYAKRAKNEVFDHLIKFGWFDWSDIAYNDSAKFSEHLAMAIGHAILV